MNGWFHHAFTELSTTLSSTLITKLGEVRQVSNQPAIPGVSDALEGGDYSKDSAKFKAALVTLRQSNHTHTAPEEATRVRVSHIRHTKGGGQTSDSDRIFVELAYVRFLKPPSDAASAEYVGQHRAFIDKTLECSLLASAKAVSTASFLRKTPDMHALDRPTPERPNPTQDPSPSPRHHLDTLNTRSPKTRQG
jgi:hypothetical protein